jgi:hypothetical protein
MDADKNTYTAPAISVFNTSMWHRQWGNAEAVAEKDKMRG